MAIDGSLLRKKIREVEEKFECTLSTTTAITLIKKIQQKYKCQKKRFKSLVELIVIEMELNYDYCRLVFAYFGSSKKNKHKKEKRGGKQMFFNF